jgi:hypothetical protein
VDNPDLPPSFNFELVKMFESENDVVQYITGSNYESTDVPKLALAVVFDGTDATVNYNYKIRVNSTGFNAPEDEGRPATPTTPPTDKNFATFIKEDDQSCPIIIGGTPEIGPYGTSCTGRYMYNGAITIQRLVNDFIMVDSGAKANGYYVAEHGVKYAPFPSPEYIQNGFYADIAGTYVILSSNCRSSISRTTNNSLVFVTFSFRAPLGNPGSALSCSRHGSVHYAREATQAERTDENDERERI